MIDPPVTIVMSVCRRAAYFGDALASALAQTRTDFEILVSDDGPTPEAARLVASLGDPRIRYRQNPRNLGLAMNHYHAFLDARGRFIANLDDDDLWEPTFLAELLPPLEADPEISLAFCDHHLIDAEGRLLRADTEKNSRRYRRTTLRAGRHQPFLEMATVRETIPAAMGSIFRKSILDGAEFPKQVGGCYDHWLAYLATRDGQAVYYHPGRLTRYRVHGGSGSTTRGILNLRNTIYVRDRFARDPRFAPWRRQLRNNLGVCYGKLALLLLERGQRRRAWPVERYAFSLMSRPKTILGLLKNTVLHFIRRGPASAR